MLLKKGLGSKKSQLLTVTLVPLVFGALAFLYSFFGLVQHAAYPYNFQFHLFQVPPVQEIGGHFLFGYAAALLSRNVKIGVIVGLMALTIDFDHLLSAVGLENVTRLAHSIPFAIMSCILMGIFVSRFFKRSSTTRAEKVTASARSYSKEIRYNKDQLFTDKIFSQFLIITLVAFLSHIAFDAFVDEQAGFPLFAPFSFNEFMIPSVYALPIEAAAALITYLYYMGFYRHHFKARLGVVVKDEK
jgi:LexA-binding, inner membrane-associated putative hydrolase